jgi:hypothetical protein
MTNDSEFISEPSKVELIGQTFKVILSFDAE